MFNDAVAPGELGPRQKKKEKRYRKEKQKKEKKEKLVKDFYAI